MAGDIDIVIGAQDKASAVINNVAGKVGGFASGIFTKLNPALLAAGASLGAAAAAFLSLNAAISKVNESASKIDTIAKAARGIGSSVAELQSLQFALGEIAGIDGNKTADTLKKMQRIIGDMLGPNVSKAQLDVMEQLGLDPQTLAMQSPVEQFRTIQAEISKLSTSAERAAIASKLLGKGAVDILPAFIVDVEELNTALEHASDVGLTLTDAQASGVESMNDAIARATGSLDGMFNKLTAELAPAVTVVADAIVAWVPPLVKIADEYLPAIVDGMVVAGGYAKDFGSILYAASGRVDFIAFAKSIDEFGNTAVNMLIKVEEQRQKNRETAFANAEKMKGIGADEQEVDQQALAAEQARQAAVASTVAELERRLLVLNTSEDFVKRGEQLALATNDAEADRIALLQQQIAEQEALNEAVKAEEKAIEDALKMREKQQEDLRKEQERMQGLFAQAPSSLQATEGRLLTRGSRDGVEANTRQAVKIAEEQKTLLQRSFAVLEQLLQKAPIELLKAGPA